MFSSLIDSIIKATDLSREVISKILVRSNDIDHGDYALPCFLLAKEWKKSPPECAAHLASIVALPKEFIKTEAAGPYCNFFLNRSEFSSKCISEILTKASEYGRADNSDKTYIVEYSSPNIAKPFHVGHLRATLIGLALDRMYRHLGYKVIAINHLGDWGTQFGFVYAGCKIWGKPERPTIDDLVDRYRQANALRKAQDEKSVSPEDTSKPEINAMAREYFVRLEAGDSEATEFWKWALDISMEYYLKVYKRIGAHFDHYTGESFYRDKLDKVENDLRSAGILSDSKGALGVDLGKKLGFVRVFTEDGRSLYITRDLATADYRYHTYNPDKVIMVIGNPQELYLRQLFAILEMMKHPIAGKLTHVSFGYVPGISTRKAVAGDERISLGDLLDDAHDRALEAYRREVEKRPEGLDENKVAESVGLGAVFFDYLARTNIKDFHFDWDTALNFQGDTGPYILYALARMNSVEAKAKEAGLNAPLKPSGDLLKEDDAYRLISLLSRFQSVIEKATTENEPYHVALYALEIAKTFSAAYRSLRVMGEEKPLAEARLSLFKATKQVLTLAITLIGMQPIDRM